MLLPRATKRKSAHKAKREKSSVKKLITLLLIVCMCLICSVTALADDETEITGGFTPIGIGETPAEPTEPDNPPTQPTQPASGGGGGGGGTGGGAAAPSTPQPSEPTTEPTTPRPSARFTDVASDKWYAQAVDYVASNSIMNGIGDGKFAPEAKLTRAMIAQILYNLEGRPMIRSGIPFDDVAEDAWYAMAVSWAESQGIMEGYGNGKFGPNDDLTREQLVTILCRYAGVKGQDITAAGSLNAFADGEQVSPWAKDGMTWAVAKGVIKGDNQKRLNPKGTATRAEVAQVMPR